MNWDYGINVNVPFSEIAAQFQPSSNWVTQAQLLLTTAYALMRVLCSNQYLKNLKELITWASRMYP